MVSGPMNGLTLGMWLQRQINASKKKRSSRYATTAQYREKTSLFSWILNAKHPKQRLVTVALLVGGVVLSPLTYSLQYFSFSLIRDNGDSDTNPEVSAEMENGWMDGWRSVPLLRRLVTSWKRLVLEASWHRYVFNNALTTALDLYDPTRSLAFSQGVLYISDEVVLIQEGIGVIEREVARARKALQTQQDDMARFSGDNHLWFPFRNKCYSLKQRDSNFKLCPFQVRKTERSFILLLS